MARTNIAVDQNVFEEFSAQANRQNKTLFAFANESLSAVSKICAEGGGPSELYPIWRTRSILKQIDVITLPSDFVDELVARLYNIDKASLFKMFQDLGSRLVALLKIAASDLETLAQLAKDLTIILPVKQLKLITRERGSVEVDIVGAGRRIESTECTAEFVKSISNGYGYNFTKQEISIGTLRIWATKRSEI